MNENDTTPSPPRVVFRTMQKVFFGLCGSMVLLIIIALVVNQVRGAMIPGINEYRMIVIVGLVIFSIIMLLLARRKLEAAITEANQPGAVGSPLKDRLGKLMGGMLISLALCEGPIVFSILLFMWSGKFEYLVFGAVLLGYMLSMVPTKKKVVSMLQLNSQEERELG